MEEYEKLSLEEKKDILNLETRKLLSILDKINDEEYEYYNYKEDDLNEEDFLVSEYNLIKEANEKLMKILKE